MIRRILLANEPLFGSDEAVVELRQDEVVKLALELTMQLAGLVDSVKLAAQSGRGVVMRPSDAPKLSRGQVETTARDIVFVFGKNQLEYIQAFLLRAYRDGAAEVDHVHIEGAEGSSSFDLTLMFEVSSAPLTAEQAKLLLDDM